MATSDNLVFEFAEIKLDLGKGLLEKSGRAISVRPKTFALLSFFVRNPNRVLSKADLFAAVWGRIIVTDDALTQTVRDVRRVLGDDAATMLRSVPRRGYAFSMSQPVVQSQASQVRASIAVLPFINLSDDPGQQYFSDGIVEDLITELSRFRSLAVIARNSSFQFGGPAVDIAAVRSALNIGYVVQGSVRRSGSRVRLTAQLIDANAQSHVWAERYDVEAGDIFAVQGSLAQTIAATLEGRVAAGAAERSRRKPTAAWVAYDHFLRGRELADSHHPLEAERCFARAIELDPDYTHAYAWSAQTIVVRYWQDRQPETMRQAEAHASKALLLDNHDAWSHWAMGFVKLWQWQFELAGIHLDRAVSLNPLDTHIAADRASWLRHVGRLDEALEVIENAMRRDPFPAAWLQEVHFGVLFQLKRYAEAITAIKSMAKFHYWTFADLAATYAQCGRIEDARREMAQARAIEPNLSIAFLKALDPFADESLGRDLVGGYRKAGLPEE